MIRDLRKCTSKYIVEHLNHHCKYRITSYQTTEISNLYDIIFIKIMSWLINIGALTFDDNSQSRVPLLFGK